MKNTIGVVLNRLVGDIRAVLADHQRYYFDIWTSGDVALLVKCIVQCSNELNERPKWPTN